ncbi:hypothetical protein GGS20DRAFT_551763 [Poronia punctata]|nr:hypothetical protein GGS20DRAFT_551763 [Poronia punctata]
MMNTTVDVLVCRLLSAALSSLDGTVVSWYFRGVREEQWQATWVRVLHYRVRSWLSDIAAVLIYVFYHEALVVSPMLGR